MIECAIVICCADDVDVRVSISIALAQSTRISVQETQVMAMVESTSSLPGQLRKHGAVSVPYEELAALIGLVFLQKTALNLQVSLSHSTVFSSDHCNLNVAPCISAKQVMACCPQAMP